MESNKNQRIETRYNQSQINDIDSIIESESLKSQYKLTRADVIRSFVEQGIDNYNSSKDQKFTLGERLNIYFTLERPNPQNSDKQSFEYEWADYDIIKSIYLNDMIWFFNLDRDCLEKLNFRYKKAVESLLNANSNRIICNEFNEIYNIIKMFERFNDLMAENGSIYNQKCETLASIKLICEKNNLSLKYCGYPENKRRKAEMAAIIKSFINRKIDYPHIEISDEDFSKQYNYLYKIYQEKQQGSRFSTKLTLDELHDIVVELSAYMKGRNI